MDRRPQLQAGHWYLVYSEEENAPSIRGYMADGGWHPANPAPTRVICEMSRTHHPDNVDIADDFVVSDHDRAIIDQQFPPAVEDPLIARGVRALAERLCVAAGHPWDPDWQWDEATEPTPMANRHVWFLVIAAAVCRQSSGTAPQVRSWDEVQAKMGDPEGIFRPKRWPAEDIPGAVPLPAGTT
ncbi:MULTISPECIES: hypothetical protein [Mycobacteriaceae]|uniref:Uncharacterized protein n=1 Tax=Mycolicibacillus parakoreensis TaxID=1069221 RepID=A0ABY3U489_9MYCO|nr:MULTISPECIES: hypothetical protein [Mycobacteriaceae]MCV7316200.1 hypothetical protein [Mycolicibacillus parakoreensis]ULN54790.1 hypothetical protein MIU77_18855 [Mycolicibacillus parakoreensis]